MSQIKSSHLILSALLALALGGCGNNENDKTVFTADSKHSSGWVGTHKVSARENVARCAECHGEIYTGGISKVSCMSGATAVSGFSCHVTSPVANMVGCVSCHGGSESGPFGTAAPNMKSAHTKHTALKDIGCSTCHSTGGSGTSGHAKAAADGGFSKARVAISTLFTASGTNVTLGYNATTGTCSSVSCHGGQTTPAWSGTINIVAGDNTLCQKCHEQGTAVGKPQYNSYYSGLHEYHMVKGLKKGTTTPINANCTDCHNISTLLDFQKHFSGVAANKIVEPGLTIGIGTPTKIDTYSASKTCTTAVGCHSTVVNVPWVIPQ